MIELKNISNNNVVTLYSHDLEADLVKGFLVACNEEELVLACINNFGENDGFLLMKTACVYRVDCGSFYEKKLETLYRLKAQKHEEIPAFEEQHSLRENLLLWAYQRKKIVTFSFLDDISEICGYIEDPDVYRIRNIDQYECKPEQGYTYVVPEKADTIWVDEKRSRDAEIIYRFREGMNV